MVKKPTFYETVNEAIRDMSIHGYDSAERVAYWTERLRKAAASYAKTSEQMGQMLRDALEAVYRRLVDNGGVLKAAPGVARFTIERVRPALRAELDRRILASASLIKLNREEAMEKTLRRFQGWATSIPVGGSAEPEKKKAVEGVRKAMSGLPFVERRVLIDQGHKLTSAVNTTVAVGGGAVAAIWHSNYRQSGYDYRPDHKERDDHVYLVRGSWAQEKGLVKPGAVGYTDDITQPAEEPFCRCRFQYIFSLRNLPDDMLTVKGRNDLARTKVKN